MGPRIIEHKKLGVRLVIRAPEDLTQADLERFGAAICADKGLSKSEQEGANVRAGLAAGWILEPAWTPEQVGAQRPAVIKWIAAFVDALYKEVTTIPPE